MVIVHLTASSLFGGPERQMLELARALPAGYRSVYVSFSEGGRCRPFLEEVGRAGFEAIELKNDTPWLRAAYRELTQLLRSVGASVLCCHGYKADLVGYPAARRAGVPVVAVSRGWTAENRRVRFYEWLDRRILRCMDRVVCVSECQATRVRRAGVSSRSIRVIRNAIRVERFEAADPAYREQLRRLFPTPRRCIVAGAGRLSPEKGFGVLVEAARRLACRDASIGFVQFGDGPLREKLAGQIARAGLLGTFVLQGHRRDLDRFYPYLDLLVLPSYTEGLPNVVLEALAARVPVVATAVGGTPEVLEHGVNGYLVPAGEPGVLADRIEAALASEERRRRMGELGRQRVLEHFSFAAQSWQYQRLFAELCEGAAPAVEYRLAG